MNNIIPKKSMEVSELKKKLDNLSLKQMKIDISSSSHNKEQQKAKRTGGKLEVEQLIKDRMGKNKGNTQQNNTQDKQQETLNIGDFTIQATLGTGTFGRVRQVRLKKEGKEGVVQALKMLKKTEIVRLNQVEHIKNEKNILLQIRHPFIVEMRSCFQDDKYVYMLLEYVQGGELFSRLRKDGRFSNDVSLFYATQIVLAIHYLHQNSILYRDLKPENLLIDSCGHIKLTDFGFAKQVQNDRAYTLCGTPEYLAPEIVKGNNNSGYGKAVDWWAVGILIFEMLSGYPPFYDNDPQGIYNKIIGGIIEFPKFFEVRAKDLIRKLLNPEVKERLGSIDAGEGIMRHKWFQGVDWERVYMKDISAPWIPYLKSQEDHTWFESYPDSKRLAQPLQQDLQHLFQHF